MIKKITLSALILFLCLDGFAQKTYLLKQNFPVGKKYSFSMISDQIINQKIAGQQIALSQNIRTDYLFAIRKGDADRKDIEVTYDRLFIKSSSAGQVVQMDSEDQDTAKVNPFRGMKGASFQMLMSADGSISSISGLDQMLSSIADHATKDPAKVAQIKATLSRQFSAESIKQGMQSSLQIYPSKPVKIGESWTVEAKVNMTMPVETVTTYTLKEVKDGIAYLNIRGTLTSKGSLGAEANKMETDLTGTNAGDAELDLRTGLIMKSHLRIEMNGTLSYSDQPIEFELQGINKINSKEVN